MLLWESTLPNVKKPMSKLLPIPHVYKQVDKISHMTESKIEATPSTIYKSDTDPIQTHSSCTSHMVTDESANMLYSQEFFEPKLALTRYRTDKITDNSI